MALVLFIGFIRINPISGACNVCGTTSQIACLNQTSFQRCTGSTIVPGTTVTCPSGTYCNSDSPMRCVSTDPSCGGLCGVCNPNTFVACLSKTQYAYCFGSTPSNQVGNCGTGEICNSDSPAICFNQNIIAVEPTCPDNGTPTTTPTTQRPIDSAQAFCSSIKRAGRYSKPNDFNCKNYYYCWYVGNVIYGQEYQCLGQTFFNCQTLTCNFFCINNCTVPRTIENQAINVTTRV
ncbi:uncharacterized protein LOC129612526 [Condylostylus longicornis]|uniref:uncharacterized protein LOC129612526 n=1 Tax=Condylostylus longicornis TaxID=2530218 RepID=UPI00244DA5ED|nr:uncharacterized protein LOC129612526 [Condylostylus longicornis]